MTLSTIIPHALLEDQNQAKAWQGVDYLKSFTCKCQRGPFAVFTSVNHDHRKFFHPQMLVIRYIDQPYKTPFNCQLSDGKVTCTQCGLEIQLFKKLLHIKKHTTSHYPSLQGQGAVHEELASKYVVFDATSQPSVVSISELTTSAIKCAAVSVNDADADVAASTVIECGPTSVDDANTDIAPSILDAHATASIFDIDAAAASGADAVIGEISIADISLNATVSHDTITMTHWPVATSLITTITPHAVLRHHVTTASSALQIPQNCHVLNIASEN
ncbi:uncharacterized protein LAESUDRAFT_718468 [Laetiporus sulphureus 93-53]|uniref:Uncharacterized protein n=1 Tax=Laetiporus sulphureus 93-53 TaxID=1314785 RepID=A0A165AXM0_9APHY|nr:uncharacterized protein LAESUDRAFT_718468 [Laetiporus sulphureus 93-53]KZS99852.1 hypothetical protein LAESUDRAFT_718468 [Laetiporus sulphureus 93-53]